MGDSSVLLQESALYDSVRKLDTLKFTKLPKKTLIEGITSCGKTKYIIDNFERGNLVLSTSIKKTPLSYVKV